MMCGSATGELLPPYVVYKATNLYKAWCEGGPEGTMYSVTKLGWFDMFVLRNGSPSYSFLVFIIKKGRNFFLEIIWLLISA